MSDVLDAWQRLSYDEFSLDLSYSEQSFGTDNIKLPGFIPRTKEIKWDGRFDWSKELGLRLRHATGELEDLSRCDGVQTSAGAYRLTIPNSKAPLRAVRLELLSKSRGENAVRYFLMWLNPEESEIGKELRLFQGEQCRVVDGGGSKKYIVFLPETSYLVTCDSVFHFRPKLMEKLVGESVLHKERLEFQTIDNRVQLSRASASGKLGSDMSFAFSLGVRSVEFAPPLIEMLGIPMPADSIVFDYRGETTKVTWISKDRAKTELREEELTAANLGQVEWVQLGTPPSSKNLYRYIVTGLSALLLSAAFWFVARKHQ